MSTTTADKRNLQWKSNNVGSKLLQKMGWKDGQAVGKRQLKSSYSTASSDDGNISSEGIRIMKRQDGLGLGATATGLLASSQGTQHVEHFSHVLAHLQKEHKTEKKKKKKSKSSKSPVTLPTNKSTHHKVRQAKFQEKTAEEMKCIFGGVGAFPVIAQSETPADHNVVKKSKKQKGTDSETVENGDCKKTSETTTENVKKKSKKRKEADDSDTYEADNKKTSEGAAESEMDSGGRKKKKRKKEKKSKRSC